MKLRCENLVKKYGPRTVVKGVSMEVKQGEIVGFLGPNGAGKTTSFYMITGLIVPASEPLGAFILNTENTARVSRSRPTPFRIVIILKPPLIRAFLYGQSINMRFQEVSNRFVNFFKKWKIVYFV